jgi:ribosomal protein S18 acetylase RimI-like enzyme
VVDVHAQAHQNLCDFTLFVGGLDRTAASLHRDGIVAVRGGVDWPSTRMAVRESTDTAAADFAAAIDDFLLGHGKSACVFVRDGVDDELDKEFETRGFQVYGGSPEMICEARLEDRAAPEGTSVRLASTPADITAYADIAARAFTHLGFHEEATRATLDNPDVMLADNVAVAIAELDGNPVAGACVVMVGDEPNGYVGWVACLDEARGGGLGDTVTRLVTNEAFARGAGIVTLEASQFGEHTYARMGYREIYRYHMLIKFG